MYEPGSRTAKLELGRLGRGEPNAIEVSVRLKGAKAGLWTVKMEAGANNVAFAGKEELVIEVKAGVAPVLRVVRPVQGNPNTLRLRVSGRTDQRYQIQTTRSLVSPVQWTDGPSFTGPEWFQDVNVNAVGTSAVFYRAVAR